MTKRGRNNQILLDIAKMVYTQWSSRSGFVVRCTDEQQIVFHEFAKFLQTSPRYKKSSAFDLSNNYPFVKINGEWYLSAPKAYMFFFTNRHLIASFPDSEGMQVLFAAIQASSRYADDARALDEKLSPNDFENSTDYASQMSELYNNHLTQQLKLFS